MLHGAVTSAESTLTKAVSNPLDNCHNPSLSCVGWSPGKKLLINGHTPQEQIDQCLKGSASVLVLV